MEKVKKKKKGKQVELLPIFGHIFFTLCLFFYYISCQTEKICFLKLLIKYILGIKRNYCKVKNSCLYIFKV